MYIRNYPVLTSTIFSKGNLTFAFFNDIVDLNPIPLFTYMLTPGQSAKCKMSEWRSVGSGIDAPDRSFANKEAFVRQYNSCIRTCTSNKLAERDNCRKHCFRGHWKDRKCVSSIEIEPQVEAFTVQAVKKRWSFMNLILIVAILLCVIMCVFKLQ